MIMCEECEAKFKIKCEDELPIKFCPYCGNPLHNDGEWEIDEDEDE
jgi:rRNA maturation endonuclease Nob1|tara:strand:- start:383 stop:520 length:138 start_codon:yes stop_codon:yes gene_type:complete